jgi:transposase
MKRFIEGANRTQVSLLPDCVDDYVGADDPVRVIEAFVDELDLREVGFESIDPEATGRPAYPPSGTAQDLHLWVSEPRAVEPAA